MDLEWPPIAQIGEEDMHICIVSPLLIQEVDAIAGDDGDNILLEYGPQYVGGLASPIDVACADLIGQLHSHPHLRTVFPALGTKNKDRCGDSGFLGVTDQALAIGFLNRFEKFCVGVRSKALNELSSAQVESLTKERSNPPQELPFEDGSVEPSEISCEFGLCGGGAYWASYRPWFLAGASSKTVLTFTGACSGCGLMRYTREEPPERRLGAPKASPAVAARFWLGGALF